MLTLIGPVIGAYGSTCIDTGSIVSVEKTVQSIAFSNLTYATISMP